MTVISRHSKETMNLVDSGWWFPIKDISHFARVNSNTLGIQDMTKEWYLFKPKFTLTKFGIKLMYS